MTRGEFKVGVQFKLTSQKHPIWAAEFGIVQTVKRVKEFEMYSEVTTNLGMFHAYDELYHNYLDSYSKACVLIDSAEDNNIINNYYDIC